MSSDPALGLPPSLPATHWNFVTRLLFRFAFVYFVLYNLPFPLTYLPYAGFIYAKLWHAIVPWVGGTVFGLKITVVPNGSGDTTWNYVQVFCFAVLALIVTAAWSLLDRRRPHYERLHTWLRVYLRFALACAMLTYGLAKVFEGQFLPPGPSRLVATYGESSPMGLLWTFMGTSKAYCVFTGLAEILGGALLISRRTALLGAMVTAAVMANVVMLNFCYDVPVKLYSMHLLATAMFLMMPQGSRLIQAFVLNRTVAPARLEELFPIPAMNLVGVLCRSCLFAAFVLLSGFQIWKASQVYGTSAPRSPLHGVWDVTRYESDHKDLPPLLTDKRRWRRILVDSGNYLVVAPMTGPHQYWQFKLDSSAHTLTLTRPQARNASPVVLTTIQPGPDQLTLDGSLEGHEIHVEMKHVPPAQWLLLSRGFHWINEYPFNR